MESMKDVYERNAAAFGEQRDKSLFEKKWLDLFISNLSKESHVLDVGCGTGEPIASYLIKKNLKVTGTDYSKNMIELAQKNFPDHKWVVADMRELSLEKKFDGIIAWNSFFHLNHEDQIKTLSVFYNHLSENGILMFTAGPEHGDVTGAVNGEKVHHWSFSKEEYTEKLSKLGFEIVTHELNDPECQSHSVYLARLK